MARARSGVVSKKRHKKILKMAKGYRGRAKSCFRVAIERVEKALQYQYRDRRNRKRDFRSLWIARINAAVRQEDMKYSTFMHGLKEADVNVDRKILAELAVREPAAFSALVAEAKSALAAKEATNEKVELKKAA